MPDFYCSTFQYAGKLSSLYGVVISNILTSRFIQTSGSIAGLTVFNRKHVKRYLVADDYANAPLTFDVDISTADGHVLSDTEQRTIQKWLFNNRAYSKLYIDIDNQFGDTVETVDGAQKRLYLNCRFINPEKQEYNGGVVGYKCTLEADSNMYWQDPIVKTIATNITTTTGQAAVSVTVDTDSKDYTYPTVTIQMGTSGGSVSIINNTDNSSRITKIDGIAASGQVIMYCDKNMISGNYYDTFSRQNFVRLLDGVNNFTVIGNVTSIKFEYQNRRLL